jgi:putative PIN family toxin of toxin-antitoxin system
MARRRFVLDSNVLISAALSAGGRPRAAVDRVREIGVLLFSDPTWSGLVSRLKRSKFDRWVSPQVRLAFLEALLDFAEWTEISAAEMGCRDPADDRFLETAETGEGEAIVTGDADLLALHPWRDIPILTPVEFLAYRFGDDA